MFLSTNVQKHDFLSIFQNTDTVFILVKIQSRESFKVFIRGRYAKSEVKLTYISFVFLSLKITNFASFFNFALKYLEI